MQENNEDAKRHIETAIDIFKEIGAKDMHFAAAQSAKGEIHFLERDYPAAVKAFEIAAETILANYGKCPPYEMVMKNLQQVKKLIE